MGYISAAMLEQEAELEEKFGAMLWEIVSEGSYLREDYECPHCGNEAFPCGCLKTPAMEKEVDTAIRDYRAGRFSVYEHYVRGKLCLFGPADKIVVCRWGVDKEDNDRKKRFPLPKYEQELYQALLKQRLYTLNLTLD